MPATPPTISGTPRSRTIFASVGAGEARDVEDRRHLQGRRHMGRQHDPAAGHPGAAAGRAGGSVRHRAGGSAGSHLPRPGRRRDAVQAPEVRRRAYRYADRARDQRASRRPQPRGRSARCSSRTLPPRRIGASAAASRTASRAGASAMATTWSSNSMPAAIRSGAIARSMRPRPMSCGACSATSRRGSRRGRLRAR